MMECAEEVPPQVHGDQQHIREIFIALVGYPWSSSQPLSKILIAPSANIPNRFAQKSHTPWRMKFTFRGRFTCTIPPTQLKLLAFSADHLKVYSLPPSQTP